MQLKSFVTEVQTDEKTFVFIIEYVTNQGDLFMSGPCCGETEKEIPPVSQFQVTVEYFNNAYHVMD
jgi:hypothetical protein